MYCTLQSQYCNNEVTSGSEGVQMSPSNRQEAKACNKGLEKGSKFQPPKSIVAAYHSKVPVSVKELAEVSESLSCAKDKLTSKLDEVVANIENTDKTKKAFKDTMFDTRKEAERSKDKIAEAQELIQGLQMRISEIDDLATPLSKYATAKETNHNDKSTNIVIEET